MAETISSRARDRLSRLVPSTLLSRVRWLFLLFILLSALTSFILIADVREVATARRLVAALSVSVWLLWAWARFRRPWLYPVTDLVPVASVVVLGLAMGSADWVFAPAFVSLYYRAMFGTRRQSVANALLYFSAYASVATVEHGGDWWATLAPPLFLLSFVGIALVMQALGGTAAAHEATAERERVLAEVSSQLLRAASVEEIHRAAAEGAFRMAGIAGATAGVWVLDDALELVAVAGAEPFDISRAPLELAPPGRVELLFSGRPYVLDPEMTRQAEEAFGHPPRFHEVLVAPLTTGGDVSGLVVLASPRPFEVSLLDVLGRFANEVSLAGDRARLVAELERANEELRRADEVKNRFLSTVSHELRAPLTSICGFAHTLRERWELLTDAQREQYLDVIHRQGLRQTRLVEDLLMTSRLASGDLAVRPERADLPGTVEAVALELGLEQELQVVVAADARWVWVDPSHLTRILTNLLTNAVRYGALPVAIAGERDGDQVRIDVTDHGPGVPDSFRPYLFEPFRRADEDTGTSEGDGVAEAGVGGRGTSDASAH